MALLKTFEIRDPQSLKTLRMRELPASKPRTQEKFCMLYAQGCWFLARKKLTGEQYRVLFYMLAVCHRDNEVWIDYKDAVAQGLGSRPNLARAVRALCDAQVLCKSHKIANLQVYTLSPFVAWNGTVEDRIPAQSHWPHGFRNNNGLNT